MKELRPIDIKRNAGGGVEIGTKEDGKVLQLTTFKDRLIVVMEKAIYELMRADDIDPERTNIALPNTIQKLLINKGTESELVSETFLTADSLFKQEHFDSSIITDRALELSFDILKELTILEKEINEYFVEEKNVIEEFQNRKKGQTTFVIPSIINLETRCKTIFQKADHVEQILMEIITVFYPKCGLSKQSHFPKFYEP